MTAASWYTRMCSGEPASAMQGKARKDAVIGAVHRYIKKHGLPSVSDARRAAGLRVPEYFARKPGPPAPTGVPMREAMTAETCLWPVGDLVCGAERSTRNYCAEHAARAHSKRAGK